jgi:hypothetical protein
MDPLPGAQADYLHGPRPNKNGSHLWHQAFEAGPLREEDRLLSPLIAVNCTDSCALSLSCGLFHNLRYHVRQNLRLATL